MIHIQGNWTEEAHSPLTACTTASGNPIGATSSFEAFANFRIGSQRCSSAGSRDDDSSGSGDDDDSPLLDCCCKYLCSASVMASVRAMSAIPNTTSVPRGSFFNIRCKRRRLSFTSSSLSGPFTGEWSCRPTADTDRSMMRLVISSNRCILHCTALHQRLQSSMSIHSLDCLPSSRTSDAASLCSALSSPLVLRGCRQGGSVISTE